MGTLPGISRGFLEQFEKNGETLTGISTGIRANSFSIQKLSGQKREEGRIVRENSVSPWKSRGLAEREGYIYVTGPVISGVSLELAMAAQSRDRIQDLMRIPERSRSLAKTI